jgi:quinol monooxygenase YgiN
MPDMRCDGGFNMICAVAAITVKSEMESEFETGVTKASPAFQKAKGCRSPELHRSIENSSICWFIVSCSTV